LGDVCSEKENCSNIVSVDYSDGRCSFEVEHGADSSKVADMHEARAGTMSDVIGDAKVLIKNYT